MAWKFLNIGKANAEVDRLNAEVLKLTAERDEAKTALESNSTEVTAHAEGLQANAETLKAEKLKAEQQVATLTTQMAAQATEMATAKERLANPTAETAKLASHKAAEITGAQGQPPIATTPAGTLAGGATAGTGAELLAQAKAIKDPSERTLFMRKHREAVFAASRAERAAQ